MQTNILLKDGSKYGGKFVATRSFKNKEVLCADIDPNKVLTCAKKKARNPVIFYVPKKGMVHIY